MADFLSASLCRGRRTRLIEALNVCPRSHLVARMMQERDVPRFLVAPFGFGKTRLALDYAQTVFALEGVSWIDGRSPCFLRDLDRGIIASRLLALDEGLSLVVFDDVPLLSSSRADEFSRVIDELLKADCEVVVCTTPSCDAFARRQADRIRLGSNQLLVSDQDQGWDAAWTLGPQHACIPVVAWGSQSAADLLLEGMMREDLPDEVNLAILVLLSVCSARMDVVRQAIPALSEDALRVLEREYLALGILPDREGFDAVGVSAQALRKAFLPRLDAMAACAQLDTRDDLISAMVRLLLDAGDVVRACDLVNALSMRRAASAWMIAHQDRLASVSSLGAVSALYESASPAKGAEGHCQALAQAFRLVLMGHGPQGRSQAGKLASRGNVEPWIRGWARLIASEGGSANERLGHVLELASLLEQEQPLMIGRKDEEETPILLRGTSSELMPSEWLPLAEALCAVVKSNADPSLAWRLMEERDLSEGCRDLLAAMLVREGSVAAAEYVCARLEGLSAGSELDERPTLAMAGVRCLESDDPDVRALTLSLSPDALKKLEMMEGLLSQQKALFQKISAARPGRTRPARPLGTYEAPSLAVATHVPKLCIRLLGGLSVSLDGRNVSGEFLRRRKVSALLCLLALNADREVSRLRVIETLWPGKDEESSVKNLYSVWSSLRSLLSVGDSCPYLERTQGGYRLDGRDLDLDVRKVRELCQKMQLDEPDPDVWRVLLHEFDEIVVGGLLPAEERSSYVRRERDVLAARIVDALLASAEKLLKQNQNQLAREFANRALEQGVQREEIYYLNMRCLLACGCREAAINMYFLNRSFLAESLGIDPSPKVVELYQSILMEEQRF